MEWEKKPPVEPSGGGGGGGMFVNVMTDEQIEVLRKQIAVYATISEQLVELYESLTTQHDLAEGVRLGNLYCDPLITLGAHKITARQRWTPTPTQLQILERIFDQGIGTPSKKKVKEITSELTQHGQVSETNVYNWFQNRRARSKRKQQANNGESEVDETEVESPSDKKTKPPKLEFRPQQTNPGSSKPEPMLPPEGDPTNFGHIPFYGNMLPNPRMEQFTGKIEAPGNYNPYLQQDDD